MYHSETYSQPAPASVHPAESPAQGQLLDVAKPKTRKRGTSILQAVAIGNKVSFNLLDCSSVANWLGICQVAVKQPEEYPRRG